MAFFFVFGSLLDFRCDFPLRSDLAESRSRLRFEPRVEPFADVFSSVWDRAEFLPIVLNFETVFIFAQRAPTLPEILYCDSSSSFAVKPVFNNYIAEHILL